MGPIRVGFIGVGNQALENLLPALLQVEGARLCALCDRDEAKANRIARSVGAIPVFTDYRELIRSGGVDAIVMACPPEVHRDAASVALDEGLHVFVEKPPCIYTEELLDLAARAAHGRLITGVGLNFRFAAPVQQLIEIAQCERFGRPVHVEISHPANKPRAPMWGLGSTVRSFLLAQAIHSIDLAMHIGGEAEAVSAKVQIHPDASLIQVMFSFRNGMTGSLLTGSMFPYFDFSMKVVGSKSCVVSLENMWHLSFDELLRTSDGVQKGKRWRDSWRPGPLDSGYGRSGYLGELVAFFEAIATRSRFAADFASLEPTYAVIDEICRVSGELLPCDLLAPVERAQAPAPIIGSLSQDAAHA